MIKTKAFSTLIICSILISGISHSSVLGNDEEEKKKKTVSFYPYSHNNI